MFDPSQQSPRAARTDRAGAGRKRADRAGQTGGSLVETAWVAIIVGVAAVMVVPAFLKTSATSDDVDAKANLGLALISARTSYEIGQSYDYKGAPLSTLSFAAQSPEFDWTTGSCEHRSSACVSETVVDVYAPGDGQGVVLAIWSSLSNTCWYGLDLESLPRSIGTDKGGVAFDRGTGSSNDVTDAGFYRSQGPTGSKSCSATSAAGGSLELQWLPGGA